MSDLAQQLRDILQGASNAVAGNVSGPVDLISAGLRKVGLGNVIGPAPVGGSEWMAQKGLTRPANGLAGLAGETLGMVVPMAAAAKAPQIANALNVAERNALAPSDIAMQGQRGVVPAAYVREQGKAATLPTDPVFGQAVANTPGAQVTPDGLLMRIQRNQLPEQAMEPSVRGGVFYLPEGAPQAKHYSTGKNGYGGQERINGETLIQNPLFVKGATGGKAPEAAYDVLNGKGAYQKMRDDAIHWGFGPQDTREEAVTKFLEKYAPDMADQAGYILQNSKRGNQLPYALQEAAVASAARRAGHDAVLGYSAQRTGAKAPFISEVFDVRESHYPDRFGNFQTWDKP